MPSSTSSSRLPAVQGPWGRCWALTLATCLILGFGLESLARRRGVQPSWSVGAESWCVEALALEPDGIALLGTSRMLSGVEPDKLSRRTGRRARQLGINATSILPVLEWLAGRPDFAGTVVAEVTPYLEFRAGFEGRITAERFLHVLDDFGRSPGRRVDSQLSRYLQTRLACRSPGFHLLAPYRDRRGPGIRRLKSLSVEANRFTRLEFEEGDGSAGGGDAGPDTGRPAGKAEVLELVDRFASAARAIQERGGRVVFLCMPCTGKMAEREERAFPRKEYWDRLAAATTAEAIHFKDVPALAAFDCPDGEHLDYRDAHRFTRELAEVLNARR